MASIQENLDKYLYSSTSNMFDMFDLIERKDLQQFDKWFIEATLFLEMYDYTSGSTFDANDDKSKDYFLQVFKNVNKSLDMNDNRALRKKQCNLLLEIYQRHYIALHMSPKLLKPYILISYINKIDRSHKNRYIESLFNVKVNTLNNLKFKEITFTKALDTFLEFWESDKDSTPILDDESVENYYEIIKTIIKLHNARGYTYD